MGLGRFELPTSPLSGVRSNQLSYRPSKAEVPPNSGRNRPHRHLDRFGKPKLWGAPSAHEGFYYRRTNWWSWSGSNRRPPECKSGALPAELQPLLYHAVTILAVTAPGTICNRGRLDAAAHDQHEQQKQCQISEWRSGVGLDWKGCYLLVA